MARAPDWHHAPMAQGDPTPRWPLPEQVPKFATWSFGGGRPFGCTDATCERWHAGIDLTGAPDGALVLAPEDATIVALDRGWSAGSKAVFLRTNTGLFLVLGGFRPATHKEFALTVGQPIRKADKLGRVLGSYGMIHLETYGGPSDRSANTVWPKGNPLPRGLHNPTNYVERMVGDRISLILDHQRHQALKQLGYYEGPLDAAWSAASSAALRLAQLALGLEADGKWGPATETAIHRALDDLPAREEPAAATPPPPTTSSTQQINPRWLIAAGALTATGLALAVSYHLRARSRR